MPHYYFDVIDDHGYVRDDVGTELSGLSGAEAEVLETLPEMALHQVRKGSFYEIAINVRDESGNVVLKSKLSVTTERMGVADDAASIARAMLRPNESPRFP